MDELYGINIAKGLSIVGGMNAVYCRLLGKFAHGAFLGELREAVESADCERVAAKAHALKGVAANLGLEPLHALALAIEQKGKRNEPVGLDDPDFTLLAECYEKTTESAARIEADPSLLTR
ncbi:MAG: Hpt domain-containing protein [Oscillospiraceae bacterium]|jgi:HPt (histidine-containing phosphotransfer) domain-containing protein|nr:Hpt domain-containing protein [Oscillospiraceae bacterium]